MKRTITASLILLPLLDCSSSTETNIPRDNTPAAKVQDASHETIQDSQTPEDYQAESIDGNHDGNTEGIGDASLLDVSDNTPDATEEPEEETDDANPEESGADVERNIADAGTDRTEEKDGGPEESKETSTDAPHDASTEADSASDTKQEATLGDTGLDCPRGCALQGRFACWPIREHPVFDMVVSDFIVKDRCTGLHWESHITASSTYYTFDDAARACRSKALPIPKGVTAQWRMPTRLELASILDYGVGGPVLNTTAFAPSLDQFWTSSQTPDALSGWTLTMYQGTMAIKLKTQNYYGRCVLDPLGDLYDNDTMWHFDQSVAGQFFDKGTLLTWEAGDSQNSATRAFSSAQGYCQAMGWRLPTLKELFTILDGEIVGAPGITAAVNSQVLPNALAGYYWADTTVYDGGMTSRHWVLHFGTGLTSGTETSAYVRCVR